MRPTCTPKSAPGAAFRDGQRLTAGGTSADGRDVGRRSTGDACRRAVNPTTAKAAARRPPSGLPRDCAPGRHPKAFARLRRSWRKRRCVTDAPHSARGRANCGGHHRPESWATRAARATRSARRPAAANAGVPRRRERPTCKPERGRACDPGREGVAVRELRRARNIERRGPQSPWPSGPSRVGGVARKCRVRDGSAPQSADEPEARAPAGEVTRAAGARPPRKAPTHHPGTAGGGGWMARVCPVGDREISCGADHVSLLPCVGSTRKNRLSALVIFAGRAARARGAPASVFACASNTG